jgi:diguanylate cyclase (GGDEF)-like protein
VHDLAARVGGEEFAVLLPETSLLDASAVAEALRLAVAELDVEFNGVAIKVTASIGGAESQATDEGVFDLMSRCDKQLYAAKRSGRNRVAS